MADLFSYFWENDNVQINLPISNWWSRMFGSAGIASSLHPLPSPPPDCPCLPPPSPPLSHGCGMRGNNHFWKRLICSWLGQLCFFFAAPPPPPLTYPTHLCFSSRLISSVSRVFWDLIYFTLVSVPSHVLSIPASFPLLAFHRWNHLILLSSSCSSEVAISSPELCFHLQIKFLVISSTVL